MQGYHRAWTYLLLASPLVAHDYTYTKLWSSWENTVFIMMQTRSVSSVGPAKPTHFSAIFLSNSKISSTRETASSKLFRVVPGTTGTRHCVAKLVAKSDVSASSMNGSAQLNYQVMKQNVLDEVQKPPKSMHQIQVVNSFQILLSRVQNVSVGSHKKSIGSTDLYQIPIRIQRRGWEKHLQFVEPAYWTTPVWSTTHYYWYDIIRSSMHYL